MNYLHVLTLSIVEGLTEFLPVSSTFHLLQTSRIMGIYQTNFLKLFEVVIQAGAVGALFFLFSKQVWTDQKRYIKLIISTVPSLVLGFFLHDYIKDVLFVSEYTTTIAFMVMGIVFLGVEVYIHRASHIPTKSLAYFTTRQAVMIGFVQALALVPGVSRSGAVIVGMLLLGYHRTDAAIYSLALSLPTILAAAGYDLIKFVKVNGTADLQSNFDLLLVGLIVSFISAYFAARWLLKYLQLHTLRIFGYYRLIAGALLLILTYYGYFAQL